MATNVTSLIKTKVTNKDWNLFRKGGVKTFATSHNNVATPPRRWRNSRKENAHGTVAPQPLTDQRHWKKITSYVIQNSGATAPDWLASLNENYKLCLLKARNRFC